MNKLKDFLLIGLHSLLVTYKLCWVVGVLELA